MIKMLLALAGAATLAAGAAAAPPLYGKEASIPFVNHHGVHDFRTVGRDTIYIEDNLRRWYRGTFLGPCNELPWANAVGFDTHGTSLDRFGTVIVRGERCPLKSLVRVPGPPSTERKAKRPRA